MEMGCFNMTTGVKLAVGCLFSFVLGGVVGIFVAKSYYEKQLDEEIERISAEFKQAEEEYKASVEEIKEDLKEGGEKKGTDEPEEEGMTPGYDPKAYNLLLSQYNGGDSVSGFAGNGVGRFAFEIKDEECGEPPEDFEIEELVYYKKDGILANMQDKPVRFDESIGYHLAEKLKEMPDRSVLSVRNPVLELDYDICVEDSSFGEEILGVRRATDEEIEDTLGIKIGPNGEPLDDEDEKSAADRRLSRYLDELEED